MIYWTPKPSPPQIRNDWSFFVYSIQSKEIFLPRKIFLSKRVSRGLSKKKKKKRKVGFLTVLVTTIKDPTTSIRKDFYELQENC